jgi:hypothetical protein
MSGMPRNRFVSAGVNHPARALPEANAAKIGAALSLSRQPRSCSRRARASARSRAISYSESRDLPLWDATMARQSAQALRWRSTALLAPGESAP